MTETRLTVDANPKPACPGCTRHSETGIQGLHTWMEVGQHHLLLVPNPPGPKGCPRCEVLDRWLHEAYAERDALLLRLRGKDDGSILDVYDLSAAFETALREIAATPLDATSGPAWEIRQKAIDAIAKIERGG